MNTISLLLNKLLLGLLGLITLVFASKIGSVEDIIFVAAFGGLTFLQYKRIGKLKVTYAEEDAKKAEEKAAEAAAAEQGHYIMDFSSINLGSTHEEYFKKYQENFDKYIKIQNKLRFGRRRNSFPIIFWA